MIYPTIRAYIEALNTPKRCFRSINGITIERDNENEPIFKASSRFVCFKVKYKKEDYLLKLYTDTPKESDAVLPKGTLLLNDELMAEAGGELKYWSVVLEPYSEDVLTTQTQGVQTSENREPYEQNGKWGFKNDLGEVVINAHYDSVELFAEGRAVVCKNGLYGLINNIGEVIIEPIYDEISYDESHLCYVDYQGKYGVINRSGDTIVECQWDWTGKYSMGMLCVELGGVYGYVDQKGKVVIDLKYSDATSFDSNGYAKVCFDGEYVNIDREEYRV